MSAVYGSFPRIRVRLSGWIFALILILGLMAALNTGFNLLYIVVSGLFSFVVVSVVLSWWTLVNISLKRDLPIAVYRKQPFMIQTIIANHKLLMPSISLRIEREDTRGESSGYILKLSAQNIARLNVREQLDRRGIYPVPSYVIMTSFPFGLFEMRRYFRDESEIIVYPRVQPLRTSVVEHMPGACTVPRAATDDGDEYFALREYQVGDDIRHIAWRTSARSGKWMIRELAQGSSRDIIMLLDTRWIPDIENFSENLEDAVELAASLGVSLLKRQYQVGIITPEEELELGEGNLHQKKLLHILASAKAVKPEDAAGFELSMRSVEKQHATLMLISPDPRVWGTRRRAGTLQILDPREVIHA